MFFFIFFKTKGNMQAVFYLINRNQNKVNSVETLKTVELYSDVSDFLPTC